MLSGGIGAILNKFKYVAALRVPIAASVIGTVALTLLLSDRILARMLIQIPPDIERVATTSESAGEVLRQSTFFQIWQPLRVGDLLYEGDRIFTGVKSQTVADFFGKLELRIPEHSLIEITQEEGVAKVRLLHGGADIVFKTYSKIIVESGERRELLEAQKDTRLRITSQQTKQGFEIDAITGKANVGSNIQLNEGDSARLGRDHSEQQRGVIDLVAPLAQEIVIEPDQILEFKWSAPPAVNKFQLLLQTATIPIREIFKQETEGRSLLARVPQPGNFDWSVASSEKNATLISDKRKLKVFFSDRPFIVEPTDEATIDLDTSRIKSVIQSMINPDAGKDSDSKTDENSDRIHVSWEDRDWTSGYTLQASVDPSFDKIAETVLIDAGTSADVHLPAGSVSLRVARRVNGKKPVWSPVRSFNIKSTMPSEAKADAVPGIVPYPAPRSLILVSQASKLEIRPSLACQSPCRLTVTIDGQNKSYSFAKGELPVAELELRPEQAQAVLWSLDDETSSAPLKGDFLVQKLSKESFDFGIKDNRKIEIVK